MSVRVKGAQSLTTRVGVVGCRKLKTLELTEGTSRPRQAERKKRERVKGPFDFEGQLAILVAEPVLVKHQLVFTGLAFCVVCERAWDSHAVWFQLRVELYTRNPDYAATACQHYSTHLWHLTFSACPPSISPPSGRNPNKPAPFTSIPSIIFCLLHRINSVENWHVPSRCFCKPGICLWSGEPVGPGHVGCFQVWDVLVLPGDWRAACPELFWCTPPYTPPTVT